MSEHRDPGDCQGVAALVVYRCACGRVWADAPSPLCDPIGDDPRFESIETLECSMRLYHCLQREGIRTVGQLTQRSARELLKIKNFGRGTLREVIALLADKGLALRPDPHSDASVLRGLTAVTG